MNEIPTYPKNVPDHQSMNRIRWPAAHSLFDFANAQCRRAARGTPEAG